MQRHVSSFIDRCIDLYIAKMNITMHWCTDGLSHPYNPVQVVQLWVVRYNNPLLTTFLMKERVNNL